LPVLPKGGFFSILLAQTTLLGQLANKLEKLAEKVRRWLTKSLIHGRFGSRK
jgi:hypothetical protein